MGLKTGEIIVMKYGEFKVIYRKSVSNGEITYLRVN